MKNVYSLLSNKCFILILSIVGLISVSLSFPTGLDICHSVINIFAGGRSVTKTFAFFAYILGLTILALIFKKKLISEKFPLNKILFTVLLAGFFLNLTGFAIFYHSQSLKPTDSIIVFKDDEISSTNLLHNHTQKGAIGFLLQRIGLSKAENVDAGFVYADKLPTSLIIATIGLGGLLFILSSLYFLQKKSEIDERKMPLFIIFYAIVTFSLLKNFIDGGFFNHETWVSFAFFTFIAFQERKPTRHFVWIILLVYLCLNPIFFRFGLFPAAEGFHGALINMIAAGAYSCLLLVFSILIYKEQLIRRDYLLICALSLLIIASIIPDLSILNYRKEKISTEHPAVLAAYENITEPGFKMIGSIAKLNLYEVRPVNTTTVGQLLHKLDIQDNFYPILLPYRQCQPHGREVVFDYQMEVTHKLESKALHNPWVSFSKIELKSEIDGKYFYDITMLMKPCLPRRLNVIEEAWREFGVDDFIILNLQTEKSYAND